MWFEIQDGDEPWKRPVKTLSSSVNTLPTMLEDFKMFKELKTPKICTQDLSRSRPVASTMLLMMSTIGSGLIVIISMPG